MRPRLYDLALAATALLAIAAAVSTSGGGVWETRTELLAQELRGTIPGWGEVEARALAFTPIGRVVTLGGGARLYRSGVDVRVASGELRLRKHEAELHGVEGSVDAARVEITEVAVREGELEARDVELTGSLRQRTVHRIRVRQVSAPASGLERWRERARKDWRGRPPAEAVFAPVQLRVRRLTERARSIQLRNVELSFAGGTRIRARQVTVPKGGGPVSLEDVTVQQRGERRSFEEMSLDLETLELVPRRSVVARTLGQQWGGGLQLDQLEGSP